MPTQRGTAAAAVASVTSVVNPTNLAPTLPAHQIGDLLLCFTICRSATPTVATPAGWTSLVNVTGTNGRLALFGKIATSAAETTPTVTWSGLTTGNSGTPVQAQCAVFTGMLDPITGIVDVIGAVENGIASTTGAGSGQSITTTTANDLVLTLMTRLDDAGTRTQPTGFTKIGDAGSTSGADVAFGWAFLVKTPAGASTIPDWTLASASSFASSGVQVALKPAPPKQTATAEISLGTVPTPETRTAHKIIVRARTTGDQGTIRAQLFEGGTARSAVLETGELTSSFATYVLAVADVDAAAITSYANLSVRLTGYSISGTATVFEVSQVYVEMPVGAAGPQTYYGATSMGVTFGKAVSGQRKTFGQIVRPFTFAATTTGKVFQTHYGSIALPIAFGKFVTGQRKAFGQVALPVIFSKEVIGQRKTFGQILSPFTFGKAVIGQRKTFGQTVFPITIGIATAGFRPGLTQYGVVSLPVTFAKDVRGQRKTFGQLLSPFIFGKVVAGQRKTFSQIAFPITAVIDIKGTRVGLTQYGVVALPITFSKDIRGQRRAFGQVALPIAFSKDIRGQRKTFGQIVFPIIFTKEAVGRKNVFGQLSMQTLFGKETAGRRKTFSQLAMPITFSKAVAGRKQTFGRVALPINATIVVNGFAFTGPKTYFGQLALPIAFGKQVVGRRKTFGQTTSPFIFGSTSQGRRRTFSGLDLPIDFEAVVKSGRVGTYGLVELELIFTMDTDGNIKLLGVILNDALELYLGEQIIDAVYVGSELVWP